MLAGEKPPAQCDSGAGEIATRTIRSAPRVRGPARVTITASVGTAIETEISAFATRSGAPIPSGIH